VFFNCINGSKRLARMWKMMKTAFFSLISRVLFTLDTEDVQKCDYGTESCSTTGVPKLFPTVAALLG